MNVDCWHSDWKKNVLNVREASNTPQPTTSTFDWKGTFALGYALDALENPQQLGADALDVSAVTPVNQAHVSRAASYFEASLLIPPTLAVLALKNTPFMQDVISLKNKWEQFEAANTAGKISMATEGAREAALYALVGAVSEGVGDVVLPTAGRFAGSAWEKARLFGGRFFGGTEDLVDENLQPKPNWGSYRPKERLRKDIYGNKVPESNRPHSQIGSSRKGTYTQARTWGYNSEGKLVPKKDIDFTDHNRPSVHPNPHQHRYLPNPTGGTLMRGDPEPLNLTEELTNNDLINHILEPNF